MMMTEEPTIWNNNKNKFCINCSIHLSLPDSDNYENCVVRDSVNLEDLGTTQVSSNSSTTAAATTSQWFIEALYSIFKLNYLNAFDTFKEDLIQEEDLLLCQNCNQVLLNLYQLYKNFLELGKISSYLNNKLGRLDEIIVHHQQKLVNCDLIATFFTANSDNGRGQDNYHLLTNQDEEDSQVHNSSNCDLKTLNIINQQQPSKPGCCLDGGREARVLLTRLPQKYTEGRRNVKKKVSSANWLSGNDDDDDANHDNCTRLLSPKVEIKIEEHAVVSMDEDDDVHLFQSPSEDSNSTVDFNPKSTRRKRKIRKKTTTTCRQKDTKKGCSRVSTRNIKNSKAADSVQKHINNNSSNMSQKDETKINKTKSSRKNSPMMEKDSRRMTRKNVSIDHMKMANYLARRTKYVNPCWFCKCHNFPTPADLLEHTKKDHLPDYTSKYSSRSPVHLCERCSRICVGDMSYNHHMKRCELIPPGVLLPREFQCSQCPKSFPSRSSLQSHMTHHSTDRPFSCDECDFQTKTAALIKAHKLNKHRTPDMPPPKQGTIPVDCDECGKTLANEGTLKVHKWSIHTTAGRDKIRQKYQRQKAKAGPVQTFCVDCNIDLLARLAYINHRRSFHGDSMGDHICHVCGKNFSSSYTLRNHSESVHSDARPFLCTKCGKSFKSDKNLKDHDSQTHTEEGRLRYNARMRESNRRMKFRKQAMQLAAAAAVVGATTTTTDFFV